MVYHIQNRILFRGFNSCCNTRTKIIKGNGKEVRGRWISGQLIEIPMTSSVAEVPQMPILCLGEPGKKLSMISDHTVIPETISQFSGTLICTDWDSLSKAEKDKWAKRHNPAEWKGIPIFEGDIFWHRIEKRYLVVAYHNRGGFFLEDLLSGKAETLWYFDLLSLKGNLWQPPKDVLKEDILRQHRNRAADRREDPLKFNFV